MTPATLKLWTRIHRWTGLGATPLLLMLAITGAPLVYHEEIDAFSHPVAAEQWDEAALPPLAQALRAGLGRRPGEVPVFMSFDNLRPVVNLTTGQRADAPEVTMHFQPIDRRTGEAPKGEATGPTLMDQVLRLHKDMFAGQAGEYLVGLTGVLFTLALVSGVVIYGPFARKAGFATVRTGKKAGAKRPRIFWVDWHNVAGGVTIAWALVVGISGVFNAFADPITAHWQAATLSALKAHGDGSPLPGNAPDDTLPDRALASVRQALPGMKVQFMAFPGSSFSTRGDMAVFLKGATPLTTRLLTPVLVNARTGRIDAIAPVPWYMQVLMLSQPLHFGDYGGAMMKVLWALLDLATLWVTVTGLYLWWPRGKQPARRMGETRARSAA